MVFAVIINVTLENWRINENTNTFVTFMPNIQVTNKKMLGFLTNVAKFIWTLEVYLDN